MKTFSGKPISPGYAQGRAVILGSDQPETTSAALRPDQVGAELARFSAALEASYRELKQLQARVHSELGVASAEIFNAHLLFLKDRQFIDRVEESIRRDLVRSESAIQTTIDELARLLQDADNPYLRERAADVRDLQRRLMRHLDPSGANQLAHLAPDSILVARELLPSDLLDFDRGNLAGIVSEVGGETGHAAILARALGVPAVTGVSNATRAIAPNMPLLIDGQTGEVVLEPAPDRLEASLDDKVRYDRTTELAVAAEGRECVTQDGVKVHLLANIGRPFEVHQVAEHHLEGVGLFRTEYLFLDESVAPSFKRQYGIYCDIAAKLRGKPLVVRTLDLGGDKWPAFLERRFEANPNLGIRGLRFSLLASQDLFRTQVRAVLCAAQKYEVQIMLPMVLGRADLRQALSAIRHVADKEGIAELPPIGTLVETPAAVFAIKEILADSDFISIGTNDLTQFILAVDRNALALVDDYTVLHPSVLRAVRQVVDAATAAGKPATICGEAASDPRVACLLIGLGARRLSMSPVSAARVRYALRASSLSFLEGIAREALNSDSVTGVSALVNGALRDIMPELSSGPVSV